MRQRANNLGSIAENFAAGLLLRNGYKIIEKNFKSRYGEIDIIAVKDGFLVFIEVKARSGIKFGLPEEAVTTSKLNKIERTGEYYSLTHPEASKKIKIEVVSLQVENGLFKNCRIIDVV